MRSLLTLVLLLSLAVAAASGQVPFSMDSAYAHLRVLSEAIGPRPMGSPGEQRALAYARDALMRAGCPQSFIMPMTVANGVNTTSGVAVGVLPGRTGRIIVLGAHIDSSEPEVPGACDNASGVACVLELARVLAKRQNESTVLFCCWGGEEQGLRGSRHFVEHYSGMDSVALMLQIDMADGSSTLEVFCDGDRGLSSPRWLTEAAFDIFYRELGYSGLRYTTHTSTLNAATGSVAGSDHIPFLDRGIPAIAFVSDIGYPIHSPLDNLANFTPSGLKRSGDLVYKLVERFDSGLPAGKPEAYYLFELGNAPVFVGHGILRAVIGAAFLLALAALLVLFRRRVSPEGKKVRWSGLKILLCTVIVLVCVLYSETLLGLLRGYRFPWVNNFGLFLLIALVAGLAGLWVVLRLAKRLTLAESSGGFFLRAIVILALFTGGGLFAGLEIALYPGVALLLVAAAAIARRRFVRWILVLLAPLLPLHLVFLESLPMMLRILASAPVDGFGPRFLYNLGFLLAFTLMALPFAYAVAGAARTPGIVQGWFRHFAGTRGIVIAGALLLVLSAVALTRDVYGPLWYRSIRAEQRYTIGEETGRLSFTSGEYLDGTRLRVDGRDTVLGGRILRFAPEASGSAAVSWLIVQDSVTRRERAADSTVQMDRDLTVRSAIRPLSVRVTYTSRETLRVESSWSSGTGRRLTPDTAGRKTFFWYSYPAEDLRVPLRITLGPHQTVVETVEVTYDSLACPCRVERDLTSVTARTVVTRVDTIGAGA